MMDADQFWARVDRSGGPEACWPWMRGATARGYGALWADGVAVGAHRVAHTLAKGPIPDGLFILHSCDNPPCCNPAHLRAGTHMDNMRDAVERNRGMGGARPNSGPKPSPTPRSVRFFADVTDSEVQAIDALRLPGEARSACVRRLLLAAVGSSP